MPIPRSNEKLETFLMSKLAEAEGIAQAQDIIEKLAQRFGLTPAERKLRDPSGMRTFDHRVHSAVKRLREEGCIAPVDESGRGIWKLTDKAYSDLEERNHVGEFIEEPILKIKSAEEATEIALSFLKKHYHFIPQQPIKATREDNIWLVEIDVGLLRTRIAKIKLDAKTAAILEYAIPTEAV